MNIIDTLMEIAVAIFLLIFLFVFTSMFYLMAVEDAGSRHTTSVYYKGKIESARYHQTIIDKTNQLAPLTK